MTDQNQNQNQNSPQAPRAPEGFIDIQDLDRIEVFMALYNRARPQGMGFIHYENKPMCRVEAEHLMRSGQGYFDYVNGRVMKIALSLDTTSISPRMYDRDNGAGAVQEVIDSLRITDGGTNTPTIKESHIRMTLKALNDLNEHSH